MDRFGKEKSNQDTDFRWPTVAQLEQMNLKNPPKLVEVRTKGEANTGLTGI